jgi:hypothetical protein
MGADVETGGFLGRFPDIAVESALAPEAASRSRKQKPAIGTVEVDLGFKHPSEGRRDGDDAAGVLLAVVGLSALEDPALMGGAADLEGLAVEVSGPKG